jgi:hypothetical protein
MSRLNIRTPVLVAYLLAGLLVIAICAPIAYAIGMKKSLTVVWDELVVSSWEEIKK